MAARHDLLAAADAYRAAADHVIDTMDQQHVSMTAACRQLGVPAYAIRRAVSRDPELRTRVAHARLGMAEHYLDEMLSIADAPPPIDKYGRIDSGAVRDKAVRLQARQFAYCKLQHAIDGARANGLDASLGDRSQPVSRVVINIVGGGASTDGGRDHAGDHVSDSAPARRSAGGEITHHDLGRIIDADAVSVWRDGDDNTDNTDNTDNNADML